MVAPGVATSRETDMEPLKAAPFGVIVGVLTVVFFEPVAVVVTVEVVGDRLVKVDTVLVVAVTVVEFVVVLVSVFKD